MICPSCDANVPDGTKFCTRCGSEVSPIASYAGIPIGTLVQCPNCGTKNFRTDNRCLNCDLDLAPAKMALAKGVRVEPEKFRSKCPSCGADNPAGSNFCGSCRWALTGVVAEPSGPSHEAFKLEGWMVAFFYLVSFFVPVAGFLLGAILLTASSSRESEFGRTARVCMILAVISLLLTIIVGGILLLSGWLAFSSSA